MPAPVYREKNHLPLWAEFEQLEKLCTQLREYAPAELCNQLDAAFLELRQATEATLSITKGGMQLGYGVNKAKKAVACDTVIAIVRQIKAIKAW